ncbi:hypothetical protein PENANT_c051G03529 [Penicillium antarcticum]|uniref:SET domain-containing protein n=1 Tax=Penicillium antarcticum TaxID=416450 RepID=A0A1V6PR07_9EURO|nr:uncharacterized protein N7508_000298 [Penicillium antarcticum]KAJ5320015.1 hypothetical protein N7508_000298 [Penicillium antarcticum]OQD79435.1 hypothetical protein PENANT_c051G03529 [Penicillium antarcticum]
MTDTSSLAITHATTDSYPVPAPPGSPAADGAVSDSAAPDEEEPYTIKCICSFEEDDGSTVFCEGCETWQHIICYYPDKKVPDVHNCVDCEPRPLDNRRATERQRVRRQREKSEDGDRKPRRPGPKTQRRKLKDSEVNGFGHQRSESSAREQPPAKKAKTSHRTSASIGGLSGIPALPAESRKRRSSTSIAMSPTKSELPIPLYSNEFLNLYDRDEDYDEIDSNLFVNVSLMRDTVSWLKDPEALARVTNGRPAEDTFQWSDAALDRSRWPSLAVDTITDPSTEISGKHPTYKIIKTQDSVRRDEVVGEITGKVGYFRDYCLDPSNRWSKLRHPEPFVFFSAHLPLYIDGRREGNKLRYIRRSCRPNVSLKIYITNDVEYHFCFVAKDDIPANTEITAMWYLDPEFHEATNGVVKQESGDPEAASVCISNTLANFGTCACDLPVEECTMAKLDRRRRPKLDSVKTNGKRRKVKSKAIASPMETGRASTSRAGSETTKHDEDDPAADSRSTSGSTRGHPRSRDLSPAQPLSELSTRERRKIADAEKQFQQLEDRHVHPKKKKRSSGPSHSTQPGYFATQRSSGKSHLDTQSRSPTAVSPGTMAPGNSNPQGLAQRRRRPVYVDAAVQCNRDDDSPPPLPRTTPLILYMSMTRRLLMRYDAENIRRAEVARQQLSSAGSDSAATYRTFESPGPSLRSPVTAHDRSDAAMASLDSPSTPVHAGRESSARTDSLATSNDPRVPPSPPPWPSTAAHNVLIPGAHHRNNLRVSMPPPHGVYPPSTISPSSATSLASPLPHDHTSPHTFMPPLGHAPTPTPAKKKLSLGDYLIRRGTMTTSDKHAPTKKSPSAGDGTADRPLTPTQPELHDKSEPTSSPNMSMKDAPESTPTHIPSISS